MPVRDVDLRMRGARVFGASLLALALPLAIPEPSSASQTETARPSNHHDRRSKPHRGSRCRLQPTRNTTAARPRPAFGGHVLWNGDFERGLLTQYEDAPWNFVGAPAAALVTSPVAQGTYAAKFVLPPGVARNELVARSPADSLVNGQTRFFAWSVYLPSDFVFDRRWRLIAQWKNDGTGSPPVEFMLWGNRWRLEGGWNGGDNADTSDLRVAWAGRALRGRWTRFVAGIRFRAGTPSEPYQGCITLWRDGVRVLRRTPFKTLYIDRESFLKVGVYRDAGIRTTDAIYQDGWKMGTTYGSVAR
jgi:hypothetical protein